MNKKKIAIINGPNMNILGKREPYIYGKEKWSFIEEKIKKFEQRLYVEILFYQSNHEGEIVDFIQQYMDELSGVVINPAALSKTGYSILDALNALPTPYVEVHLSNIFARSGWHSESIFTETAVGFIMGLKGYVYELGLRAVYNYLEENEHEKFSD